MRFVCPACQYDAQALVGDEHTAYTCPECGRQGAAMRIRPSPSLQRVLLYSCGPTATASLVVILTVHTNMPGWAYLISLIGAVIAPATAVPVPWICAGWATSFVHERVSEARAFLIAFFAMLVNVLVVWGSAIVAVNLAYGIWRLW